MKDRFRFDPELVPVAPDGSLPEALEAGARPLHIEVGFGKDVRILRAAEELPDDLFLGIEISRKKAASFCRKVARAGLRNVRALQGDVRRVLRERLPAASVTSFTVLFPDPWPKRRHWKHRWIQAETAGLLARALVPGGRIVAATDHPGYADQIRICLAGAGLELIEEAPEIPGGDKTLFAERFERLGRGVAYLVWRKPGATARP